MEATYHVFHRTWWKEATRPGWPNNLEPGAGEKHTIAVGCSWDYKSASVGSTLALVSVTLRPGGLNYRPAYVVSIARSQTKRQAHRAIAKRATGNNEN